MATKAEKSLIYVDYILSFQQTDVWELFCFGFQLCSDLFFMFLFNQIIWIKLYL